MVHLGPFLNETRALWWQMEGILPKFIGHFGANVGILPRFGGHLTQNLGHFAPAGHGPSVPPPTGSAPDSHCFFQGDTVVLKNPIWLTKMTPGTGFFLPIWADQSCLSNMPQTIWVASHGRTHPSFGMTSTFQKKKSKKSVSYDNDSGH